MSDKYLTEKSQWSKAMTQDTEIYLDNNELIKADKTLSKAYTAIQNDKYSDLSYKRRDDKQNDLIKYRKGLSRLKEYSMKIFSVVDRNEAAYAKRISKQYEEISLIDIRSFVSGKIQVSTTSHYRSTTDEIFNTRTSNANLYALLANSEILKLGDDFSNNYSEETMKAYLNEYIDSKFEHEVLIDKEILKLYKLLGYLPVLGSVLNGVEGLQGKSFTGEKYTKEESSDKAFVSMWLVVYDLLGFGAGSKSVEGIKNTMKSAGIKKLSKSKYSVVRKLASAAKKIRKYKSKRPKEDAFIFDTVKDITTSYFKDRALDRYKKFRGSK